MTPVTVKCLCCNETHRFTRYKEFWQCSCDNHAQYDAGDGYYCRMGAKDPKKIVSWKDGERPQLDKELIKYITERNDPNYFNKVQLRRIKTRLEELKANANAIKLERRRLLDERKQIKESMKK